MSNNNPYESPNYKNAYYDGLDQKISYDYDEPYVDTGANIFDLNGILVRAFSFMFVALVITALVAMYVASDVQMVIRYCTGNAIWVIFALEFAMVFLTQHAVRKKNFPLAIIGFFGYSVFTGITFSVLFVVYEIGSIANAFFITAALFLLMAAYGLITKRDMDKFGDYAMMSLLGVIVVSVFNLLIFKSTGVDWFISVITVIIFVCLTAYDTWKIKRMQAIHGNDDKTIMVLGVYGAMELYLDFINIFLKILRLLGRSRD